MTRRSSTLLRPAGAFALLGQALLAELAFGSFGRAAPRVMRVLRAVLAPVVNLRAWSMNIGSHCPLPVPWVAVRQLASKARTTFLEIALNKRFSRPNLQRRSRPSAQSQPIDVAGTDAAGHAPGLRQSGKAIQQVGPFLRPAARPLRDDCGGSRPGGPRVILSLCPTGYA